MQIAGSYRVAQFVQASQIFNGKVIYTNINIGEM